MSGECHECGEDCSDCTCNKNGKCSCCDKIRMRWDTLCFDCLIDYTKQMIKRSKDLIKSLEKENDKFL